MSSYEEEQRRLRQLWELCESDDEVFDDVESSNEEDNIEEREGGSESEQDISENEDEGAEEGEPDYNSRLCFIGKDGITKWKKLMGPKNVRTRQENYVVRLPLSRLPTRSLKTPLEIWKYFINEEMLYLIVDNTNKFINSVKENFARDRDARPTDILEIQAFLGLLYYAGVLKANHLNADDLWKTDGSGVEIFRLTMSLSRFRFLLRCIRIDDKETREERVKFDKLAPIRNFFDKFVDNCKNGYSLSKYVTVDEKLEAFRGRCSFRQYIPSKPNKYGIKIFALADAKMMYVSNMEVYVGQQPEGPFRVSNSPDNVVKRLCQHIYGSGRNLTIDNWFTSISLVDALYKEKITVIGTIRKNKRELPVEFTKPAHPVNSSMFGFRTNCTLVSYIPKKKKNVLLVSSLHHDDNIDQRTGELCKPEIITKYNQTKCGVDVVDQLCSNYNCARSTRRWPMVVFYSLLNVAGINSMVIYNCNNPNSKLRRRLFLRSLAFELIKPYLQVRVTVQNLPVTIKTRIYEICGQKQEANQAFERKTGRCNFCTTKQNRRTRYFCVNCSKFMCLEHLQGICQNCKESAFTNE